MCLPPLRLPETCTKHTTMSWSTLYRLSWDVLAVPVPVDLLTLSMSHPLGVDVVPTFTWRVPAARARASPPQIGYNIQVISADEAMVQNEVMWDSGVVSASRSANALYTGPQLEPDARYSWRVRVSVAVTGDSSSYQAFSPFSGNATFQTGFFAPDQWGTRASPPGRQQPVAACKAGTRVFQNTCEPRCKQTGSCEVLASVASEDFAACCSLCAARQGCEVFTFNREVGRCNMRSGASPQQPGHCTTGHFPARCKKQRAADSNYGTAPTWLVGSNAYRKEFAVAGVSPVVRAAAYVAALGYYELWVNGQKAGDHVLDPGYSDSEQEQLYVAHDVTGLLSTSSPPGSADSDNNNCVGLLVGSAWAKFKMVLLKLTIHRADGTVNELVTDATWSAGKVCLRPQNIRGPSLWCRWLRCALCSAANVAAPCGYLFHCCFRSRPLPPTPSTAAKPTTHESRTNLRIGALPEMGATAARAGAKRKPCIRLTVASVSASRI